MAKAAVAPPLRPHGPGEATDGDVAWRKGPTQTQTQTMVLRRVPFMVGHRGLLCNSSPGISSVHRYKGGGAELTHEHIPLSKNVAAHSIFTKLCLCLLLHVANAKYLFIIYLIYFSKAWSEYYFSSEWQVW